MDANRIVNFWVSISVILAKEKNPLNLRSQPQKSLILCYEMVFLIVAFLSLINPWSGVLCGSDRWCSGDETNSRNTCILSEIWYIPVGVSDGKFRQSAAEMWQVTDNLLAIVMHSFNWVITRLSLHKRNCLKERSAGGIWECSCWFVCLSTASLKFCICQLNRR